MPNIHLPLYQYNHFDNYVLTLLNIMFNMYEFV